MKRAIVTSVRTSKDNKSGEDNAWVTVSIMPSKMSNGNLFYPKSSEISVTSCAGALRAPDKFVKFNSLRIGALVDIHYGFNEYTQKPFVDDITLVKDSPFVDSDLIV